MSWTDESIGELTRLWDAGYSASAIGKQIGMSKNAVIGKAHRLGLRSRPSPIKRGVAKPVFMGKPRLAETTTVVEASPPTPVRSAPVARKEVRGASCLWPIGDPSEKDFHFCGEAATPGKPYCTEHCSKAYITRSRNSDNKAA